MTPTLLVLRISRRAIGATALSDAGFTLADGRHLSSRPDRTVVAAANYVVKLVDLTHPTCVVVDAPPRVEGRTTARIVGGVEALAHARGIQLLPVTKPDILATYARRGLRNRRELRDLIRQFWPELARIAGRVEPYVIDAAAAALYAECRMTLEPQSG